MSQSSLYHCDFPLLHAAIIMDGSGRWAGRRGLPRTAGHQAGVEAVRRVVSAAHELGLGALTLHSFSRDNWQRPPAEVSALFRIFEDFLRHEPAHWAAEGVRVRIVGRRDRLPATLLEAIARAESATTEGPRLDLRLAIDYSSRESILAAAQRLNPDTNVTEEAFSRLLVGDDGREEPVPAVDLLIRTGGEQRLSDFLLWECAYAELYFTDRLWPDFTAQDLAVAIMEFHSRDRRFGRLPQAAAV